MRDEARFWAAPLTVAALLAAALTAGSALGGQDAIDASDPWPGQQVQEAPGVIKLERQGQLALHIPWQETGTWKGAKPGPPIPAGYVVTGCWLWIGTVWDSHQEAGNFVQIIDRHGKWHTVCQTFVHKHEAMGGYADDDVTIDINPDVQVSENSRWRIVWQKTLPNVRTGFAATLYLRAPQYVGVTPTPQAPDGSARRRWDPHDGMAQLLPKLWQRR